MAFGLLTTGFAPKRASDIITDLESALRAAFGISLVLGNTTLLGIFVRILAERYAELWALAQAVYSSQDPSAATGAALDALCKITGTTRGPATYSTAAGILTGSPAVNVPVNTLVGSASTPTTQFQTTTAATLGAVAAWAGSTTYTLGARVNLGGNVYQVTTAGTTAASGGPTGTGASIIDGTVTWTYLGAGTAAADVTFQGVTTGPLFGASRDLTVVTLSPVAGWTGAINLLDSSIGVNQQTDGALRQQRINELYTEGTATSDAIRASILGLAGVTACTIFLNNTDATDANGVPPHSLEALVVGGDDQTIANTLMANVAGGIATYGTTTKTASDSQGNSYTIKFSRPQTVSIYIDVTVKYDASAYPADGDTEIKTAMAIFGAAFAVGRDVTASGMASQGFTIPGVLDVSPVYIGTAPSPGSSATIVIGSRQIALFDTSRITVHSTAVTP